MALAWAKKRKMVYIGGFAALVLLMILYFSADLFTQEPTCRDGVQNGFESGIDCGGKCQRFCTAEAVPLQVRWTRVFPGGNSLYNAVAVIENQNSKAAIEKIFYEFRLYDNDNIFISEEVGSTYILPNAETSIFSSQIDAGNRIPVRSEFEFTSTPVWQQVDRSIINELTVYVDQNDIEQTESGTRLTGEIINNSSFSLKNVDVLVMLYDEEGNVVAASSTFVKKLNPDEDDTVIFTWPGLFNVYPARIEIFPQINIFSL